MHTVGEGVPDTGPGLPSRRELFLGLFQPITQILGSGVVLNSRLASSDGPGNLRMAGKGKERSSWLCSEPREQLLLPEGN